MWTKQLIAGSGLRRSRLVGSATKSYNNGENLKQVAKFFSISSNYGISRRVPLEPYTSSLLLTRHNGLLVDGRDRYIYNVPVYRGLHLTRSRYEPASSKVEVTVKSLKQGAKEKEDLEAAKIAEAAALPPSTTTTAGATITPSPTQVAAVPVKKSIKQRIWEEMVHYYHGFRLLGIDTKVSFNLLWKVLNGQKLTRRENKLLVRTTSDLFRLVPFSVFILVPFMEFLLPVFIKFFPGMLPSTFQTAKDRDEKLKQHLKVKLEMAKFLQKTLDEMSVQHTDHRSEAAKQFSQFVQRTRDTGEPSDGADILKFSKLFEDELTLDSLTRQQLMALCRVLEVHTLGTNNFLRFQLQLKLRSLIADDKIIQKEGVDSLNLTELQAASRARGMRAYGMSEEHLKRQVEEWIHLSVNEKVPPILLLLSRAMMLPEHIPTSDKLKATISALPDMVVSQTKAAIGEREGKIDNRTKIEIIQEEVRRIKEEKEEETETKREEKVEDPAPIILESSIAAALDRAKVIEASATAATLAVDEKASQISSEDLEVLSDALGAISKEKKTLLVEKEDLKELKEEIADYAEDVKELHEVVTPQDKIHESKAAKMLHKKVDSMIGSLDKVLADLERKEKELKSTIETIESPEEQEAKKKQDELIHIDELMSTIKKIQKVDDESKLQQIQKILGKLDVDQDGHVKVDDILEVIETIAKDNVKLSEKQFDELINLMEKEDILESERKIQAALENELKQKLQQKVDKEELVDKAKTISVEDGTAAAAEHSTDTKKDEGLKIKSTETVEANLKSIPVALDAETVKQAVEKHTDKILPKIPEAGAETPANTIIPPPLPTAAKDSSKTKSL